MLSNALTAKAISRSAQELFDTIYQKHILRCDHSVTISQRSVPFRNGVVYIFCVMYPLIIHFGINKYELSMTIYIGLLHNVSFISITAKTT